MLLLSAVCLGISALQFDDLQFYVSGPFAPRFWHASIEKASSVPMRCTSSLASHARSHAITCFIPVEVLPMYQDTERYWDYAHTSSLGTSLFSSERRKTGYMGRRERTANCRFEGTPTWPQTITRKNTSNSAFRPSKRLLPRAVEV